MLVIVLLVKFLYFRGQEHLQRLQGYQTQKFTQTHDNFIDLTRDSTRRLVRVYPI